MRQIKIVPAILAKNKREFYRQWRKVAPFFSYIQLDIMDGKFVSGQTKFRPATVKKITRQHQLEIHLMVRDVAKYINLWEKLSNVKKIIWHYEAKKNLAVILCLNDYLKKKKIKTGLCLNLTTPVEKIAKIAKYFDTIQLMSIKSGAQGRAFHAKAILKIKKLRKKFPRQKISVDGGISDKNFLRIKNAGADMAVIGKYLQTAPDIRKALRKIKSPTK
ncbi:MAG: hypothetical protein WC465_02245 [Patescibacteria group bacterium]